MSTIIRYVNTASSGGDGTTNNTSGGTAAYASLSAAEAALRQNLTGVSCDVADEEGNNYIALDILCTGTSADTTAVNFDNASWVTDATHRIRVRLNGTGAGAKWDSSLYRLVAAGPASYVGIINVGAARHLTLQDLQVESTSNISAGARALGIGNFAADVRVVRGFYRQTSTTGTWDSAGAIYIEGGAAALQLRMQNVTAVAADGNGFGRNNYLSATTCIVRIYNCTFVNRSANNRDVFRISGDGTNEFRIKNVLCQGPGTTNYTVTDSADEEVTILTQDTSSPTTSLRSKTVTFVDSTNWDYHLQSSDTAAKNAGTSLASDSYYPFSNDCDVMTRSGSWDVGADEVLDSITVSGTDGGKGSDSITYTVKPIPSVCRIVSTL